MLQACLTSALGNIPTCTLAALLIHIGFKLVWSTPLRKLVEAEPVYRTELLIYLFTVGMWQPASDHFLLVH